MKWMMGWIPFLKPLKTIKMKMTFLQLLFKTAFYAEAYSSLPFALPAIMPKRGKWLAGMAVCMAKQPLLQSRAYLLLGQG
jgi:hypothetical protein